MNESSTAPERNGAQTPTATALPDDAVRTVSSHLELEVTEPAEIVLSVAVSADGRDGRSGDGAGESTGVTDSITLESDGRPVEVHEVLTDHGTRLHVAPHVPTGSLVVDYRATITGVRSQAHTRQTQDSLWRARTTYLRPSRYSESDKLAPTAAAAFTGLSGKDLLDAVSSWVGSRLLYLSGSSRPTDGAVQSYLGRQGVCRDFAHLTVALLRACGVPARLVSVYAPGLEPMDFHAVAEALLEDQWYVVDATTLAPRSSLVRIATGRDASDTAFLTTHSGRTSLTSMEVTAVMDPALPDDDLTRLVQLR